MTVPTPVAADMKSVHRKGASFGHRTCRVALPDIAGVLEPFSSNSARPAINEGAAFSGPVPPVADTTMAQPLVQLPALFRLRRGSESPGCQPALKRTPYPCVASCWIA